MSIRGSDFRRIKRQANCKNCQHRIPEQRNKWYYTCGLPNNLGINDYPEWHVCNDYKWKEEENK